MEENEINYEEISERMGYDILIGANNGEETRRANNLTPWKTDYEIYNPDLNPQPTPTDHYLTFTALEDNSIIWMGCGYEGYDSFPISVEYSLDNGNTWNACEFEYNDSFERYTTEPINLNTNDTIKFRGNNTNLGQTGDNEYANISFGMQGSIKASGDVTSLINNIGGDCELVTNCFGGMFSGCTSLIKAPNLPSTTLSDGCYWGMFSDCESLVEAPELPATTLAYSCYQSMFNGCISLETSPELPATTLSESCYNNMFSGCESLTTAPELPSTTLSEGCYNNMFSGCTSLEYVKMMGLNDIYGSDTWTENWLQNVSSTGTIIFNSNASWLGSIRESVGDSFVPDSWDMYDDNGNQYYFLVN